MILLGLGGNLPSAQFGAPRATLDAALSALVEAGVGVPRRSRWYRSAPVPDNGQPHYVNGVARLATAMPPAALLALLLEVERGFGRKRLMRHRVELDGNFRGLPGEAFARAEIERHVLPAPIVHEQF